MNPSAEVSYRDSEPGIDPILARSFTSRFVASRLQRGEPLTGPERYELRGAVLLTDIEGFTSHVEGLGAQGAAGLERLAAEVNAYFVTIAETTREYGGDVLGIAGDSFLCLWTAGEDGALPGTVARAAAAAARMHERIAELSRRGALAMPTRAGISAGSLSLILAGGLGGRWELVPSGPALAAAARAERHGRAGAVTLTEEAAVLLPGASLRSVEQRLAELIVTPPFTVTAETDEPAPAPELIRPFVPLPVLAAGNGAGSTGIASSPGGAGSAGIASSPGGEHRGQLHWLAELRPVTAVMVSLRDDGSDLECVHEAVRRFQEVMARFGGASKLIVDNKGLTCSGVFGLPPRAHEDDVERGLRSAQAAFEALGSLYGNRTIGVASGKVLCGVFGSDVRREYSLFGDAINIASRLSALGEGSILIDDSTAHGCALRLAGRPRPDLRVRGRRRPAEVLELTGLEAVATTSRTIIDREEERSIILGRMGDVLERGRTATVLLSGEPGIGKSTVAVQAMRLAEDAGMRRLEVIADAIDRTTPYGPWRTVVAELLGPADTPEELLDRVGAIATDVRLLPLLGSVMLGAPADNATTEGLAGDIRRDQTNELIARAIATATEQRPLALLVEDSQWLDSASWSLLLRVATEVPRLLVLVTERKAPSGEPGAAERAELLAIPGTTALDIRSLDADSTTTLIQHRLGVASVPRAVLDLILERVEGHPLFCESLVQAMVSSGTIRVGGEGAELMAGRDGIPRVDIPSSIESSVLSRVDSLRPGHEMTLKAASVVGRAFTAEEVAATHPNATGATVAEHLDELRALELIDAEDRDGEWAYTFRHQIVRDVAYQLLTGAQREPLHRNLVEHYEEIGGAGQRGSSGARLAYHWLETGEPLRALPYLEQGGRDALREGAFSEAVRMLEGAIELIGDRDPVRRALLEKSLADAHYFLGNLVGGRALLELSLERLGFPVAQTRTAAVRSLITETLVQGGRLLGASGKAHPACSPALATAVEAHRVLVQISYLHGGSAIELCDLTVSALNLAERLGPSAELARALAHAAALISITGLRPLADRYGARALEMATDDEHAPAVAYVWNVLAIMHAQRGEWLTALEANGRALELFGELGDYNFEAELWQTRSALELCRGSTDGAAVAARRTQELAERTGSEVNLCWSLLDQTQTMLTRGNTAAAVVALDAALAIPTPGSDGGTVIERWATTAWVRSRQGRYAEAVAEAAAVVAMAGRQLATGWVWAEMTVQAVEVLLDVRAAPNSGVSHVTLDRKIARGLRVLQRLSPTFAGVRCRAHVLRSRSALQRGSVEGANRALKRAERAVVAASGPLDAARIALVRAELVTSAVQREEILTSALATFSDLGRQTELERAQELLR